MDIEEIARVCHEANQALCDSAGEIRQPSWDYASTEQRDSCIAGVKFRIANPHATPEAQHLAWMAHKAANGWTYGPFKDESAKRHPCMVPFGELPPIQQAKDALFAAVCRALLPYQGLVAAHPAPQLDGEPE